MSAMDLDKLTAREREVLALIAEGLLDKQIAAALSPPRSISTVKAHVRSILLKLSVSNRAAAAARSAAREG